MLIPVLKVKDDNFEHIVGTNSHDVLYVDKESGGIQYLNVQGYEGTKKYDGKQSMQFTGETGHFKETQIQFVTVEEMVGLAIKNMEDGTEAELKLHRAMQEYLRVKGICGGKLKDNDIVNTGGALLF